MILSFDVDGTLAGQNNRAFMQACNQVLKLGLSEEDLAQLRYRQFLALPQVARQPEKVLAWMYYHPLALSRAKVIKGALEGVEVLRLVAFGVQETGNPHVIALPNWQSIQRIIDYWEMYPIAQLDKYCILLKKSV